MKKQILFLAMFTLALIFAGTTKSFGQLNTEEDYLTVAPNYCVPALPLTNCGTGDALAPMPGVPYDYTITIGTGQTVHWFVTDDVNIMTAQETLTLTVDPGDATGDYLLVADVGVTYNNPANTSATINLTWKSFNGALPNNVLLVAYVIDVDGCTDNIEVYRIEPEYAFTLDLAGIQDDGTSHADPFAPEECVSPIQSAQYDGTSGTLTVDYGMNYVYFTVNAANWQTSWETDLAASSDNANSVVGAPEWAYPDAATVGGAWNATGTEVLASHPAYISDGLSVNGFVDSDGACIIVRVPVTHGTTSENIADETINLVVNGEMVNPETGIYDGAYPDLDDAAVANDPCVVSDTIDNLDYLITPRPDLVDVTPQPFETKVPTGN